MAEYTHVLEWLPSWLLAEDGEAFWDLQTYADYAAGTPAGDYGHYPDPECGADEPSLAAWAAVQLGCPVALTAGEQEIRPRRHWGQWCRVPVYYVQAV